MPGHRTAETVRRNKFQRAADRSDMVNLDVVPALNALMSFDPKGDTEAKNKGIDLRKEREGTVTGSPDC